MTIIACSRKERLMIADTLIVTDKHRMRAAYAYKIVKCKDGAIAGAAGDTVACWEFLNWAASGRKKKAPSSIWAIDADSEGIILTAKDEIFWYCCQTPEKVLNDTFSIGYGSAMFAAATKAGAPLRRAVEIVCELSGACGGPLTELALP